VPGTDDHPDGTSDGTEVREFLVRSKGDGLAVLPILLDPPSDLDGGNGLDGFWAEILDDMLLGVVENEIVGCESLDDGSSRRVGMHVYLLLILLSVFTQRRANITT
jgi:hypothetical protein